MGVPKFFRYISERYPCLSELVREFQIPEFDNFYLDMNGIIHACSHPCDSDPHFSITEEDIFASIFHYVEFLFNLIKPRKLFFMAVDGVAPRAKMNQQRARRFRTAKEAELLLKKAMANENNDKPLPKERFDSNCITPGTVFMTNLHSQFQYFITSKISTDPLWQNCKVILSGHQTPGEGEHKIMDYIRYLKTLPHYDENTKHCLFGLDADLIILGLCTHEPHFCLLREKVQFSKQKKVLSPDETEFYLLHLSLMREYLDLEFQELKENLPFEYNVENIIDDWVLMGFLVGNDFIPNLPDLHINREALPVLYKAYKEVLPKLDGYLNENGYLNLPRFQVFMERLSEHDKEAFEETFANLAFLEEKTGKKAEDYDESNKFGLEDLIKATDDMLGFSDDETQDEDTFLLEFSHHKKNYYTKKLDYNNVTEDVLKSQAEGYIRAIQWNLHYYYQGCQSWSWYYPHHYSPFISDITNFKDLKLDFEMGTPFLPFEQLLAVLPTASKSLIPKAYQGLMTSPNSPIKDFYPEDFETDLNGKQNEWEAVVLIPFIDEKRLLSAMKACENNLTMDEMKRNQHGPMHVYTYTETNLGMYKSDRYFPTVVENHALRTDVFKEEIQVEISKLKYGLRPGVLLDVMYPDFPTLKHIPYTATLKQAKVKVFNFASKSENMVISITPRELPELENLANNLLGKTVYVNWPYLVEARAVAVSDGTTKYSLLSDDGINKEELDQAKKEFKLQSRAFIRDYMQRRGVDLGPVNVVLDVVTLEGTKCTFGPSGELNNEKIWSPNTSSYPMQVVVQNIAFFDSGPRTYVDFRQAFKVNSIVFMLGQPHFGAMGRVLDSSKCYSSGRLNVALETVKDPYIDEQFLKSKSKTRYFSSKTAALRVGISPRLLNRITKAVYVTKSKEGVDGNESRNNVNVGLNLRLFYHGKAHEIPGFTKKGDDFWLYSSDAVDVVQNYVKKFSRVVEFLSDNPDSNFYAMEDIFPGAEGAAEMKEMVDWINEQEFRKVERVTSGTVSLDGDLVTVLEKIIDESPKESLTRTMQVKPHLLYKSDLVTGNLAPIKSAKHCLLDRIVSVRSSYTVPTGLRGYIIGIHPASSEADYLYDILFDKPFVGGMNLNGSSSRTFRMTRASFLNISDANRVSQSKSGSKPLQGSVPNFSSLKAPNGKTSAFVQWTNHYSKPVKEERNDEFHKIWSNLQGLKPQEGTDVLKKILKINEKQEPVIEDPVKSFFDKVSKVKKNDSSSSGNNNNILSGIGQLETVLAKSQTQLQDRYCNKLFSYYHNRKAPQPKYRYAHVGEMVVAQLYFNDGRTYYGLPCKDKQSASESVALQVLGALGEIPLNKDALMQREKEKRIIENQMKLSKALFKNNEPTNANQNRAPYPNYRPNNLPKFLPNPPVQWVGQNARLANPHHDSHCHQQGNQHRPRVEKQESVPNSSRKPDASALEFVPLQAITGKRNVGCFAPRQSSTLAASKRPTENRKIPEFPPTLKTNVASSSSTRPRRKPKIAANLGLDLNLS